MAKQLNKQQLMDWFSNAKALDLNNISLEKQEYTKRDGSKGHSFVSEQMKATASGVSVVPNPGLGMDTAIVTLNFVRKERIGDDRFKELMAECEGTGDYNKVRNYLSIPGRANENRTCFPELCTVQGAREVTLHVEKREETDTDTGEVNTYFSIEVDSVKPLATIVTETLKAEDVFM